MRAKLGGDIGQQPLPPDQPISQVGPDVCEAKLGHPTSDPFLGVAASLLCQPLRAGWQHDPQRGQHLGDGPLGLAEFSGERGHTVPAVAAGLQIVAQLRKPELAGVLLQPPDTAVVDHKPALDDQLTGCFRWYRDYPSFGRTRGYDQRQTR